MSSHKREEFNEQRAFAPLQIFIKKEEFQLKGIPTCCYLTPMINLLLSLDPEKEAAAVQLTTKIRVRQERSKRLLCCSMQFEAGTVRCAALLSANMMITGRSLHNSSVCRRRSFLVLRISCCSGQTSTTWFLSLYFLEKSVEIEEKSVTSEEKS